MTSYPETGTLIPEPSLFGRGGTRDTNAENSLWMFAFSPVPFCIMQGATTKRFGNCKTPSRQNLEIGPLISSWDASTSTRVVFPKPSRSFKGQSKRNAKSPRYRPLWDLRMRLQETRLRRARCWPDWKINPKQGT